MFLLLYQICIFEQVLKNFTYIFIRKGFTVNDLLSKRVFIWIINEFH